MPTEEEQLNEVARERPEIIDEMMEKIVMKEKGKRVEEETDPTDEVINKRLLITNYIC